MFPWLAVWAPHLYFPWSGSVAQQIEPNTNWFFDSIGAHAGDGRIEKKAFETASYGRQLGLITDVLLELAAREDQLSPPVRESLQRLQKIAQDIDGIKRQEATSAASEVEARLKWLKSANTAEYRILVQRLRALMAED